MNSMPLLVSSFGILANNHLTSAFVKYRSAMDTIPAVTKYACEMHYVSLGPCLTGAKALAPLFVDIKLECYLHLALSPTMPFLSSKFIDSRKLLHSNTAVHFNKDYIIKSVISLPTTQTRTF